MAWSLISAAARMCIDLGLHRMGLSRQGTESWNMTKRKVFWHVYVIDKAMAFTLGRPPSIHEYDVATERRPSVDVERLPGPLG